MYLCRPATTCCCGCSVETGVWLVLYCHLARSVFGVLSALVVLVFRVTEYGFLGGDRGTHAVLAGVALAGLPLICGAIWGIRRKLEAPLWMYWYYMMLGFIIDEGLTLGAMLFAAGPCGHGGHAFDQGGKALACGLVRFTNAGIVLTLTGFEAYFLVIVYSYCQELATSGGGPDFSDLKELAPEEEVVTVGEARCVQTYLEGFEANDGYYSGYGSFHHPHLRGLGGSKKIFGRRHELIYPPPYAHP